MPMYAHIGLNDQNCHVLWSQRQIQRLDFLDYSQRQRTFYSLVNPGIDMTERIAVIY